jgi:hypothetical protein
VYLFVKFVSAREMPDESTLSRAIEAYRTELIAATSSLTIESGEAN